MATATPLLSHGQQQAAARRGSVNDFTAAAEPNVQVPAARRRSDAQRLASPLGLAGGDHGWARAFGRCLGAAPARKWWRLVVNGVVCFVVLFETVWWAGVIYSERQQPGLCRAGAVLDATRGALATIFSGASFLLVTRPWLAVLLEDSDDAAVVELAAKRWLLAMGLYILLDTSWMLYRTVDSQWPLMLLSFASGGADMSEDLDLPLAERTAIGSSNFVSGALLLSMQCAFTVTLACAGARVKHALKAIDVAALSAPELVDEFQAVKRKHDSLMQTAHGSTFLTVLIVYYLANWCWVCSLIIMGELEEGQVGKTDTFRSLPCTSIRISKTDPDPRRETLKQYVRVLRTGLHLYALLRATNHRRRPFGARSSRESGSPTHSAHHTDPDHREAEWPTAKTAAHVADGVVQAGRHRCFGGPRAGGALPQRGATRGIAGRMAVGATFLSLIHFRL